MTYTHIVLSIEDTINVLPNIILVEFSGTVRLSGYFNLFYIHSFMFHHYYIIYNFLP